MFNVAKTGLARTRTASSAAGGGVLGLSDDDSDSDYLLTDGVTGNRATMDGTGLFC